MHLILSLLRPRIPTVSPPDPPESVGGFPPSISASVVCPPGVNPNPDYVDYLIPGEEIEELSKIAKVQRRRFESPVTLPAVLINNNRDPCLSTRPPEGACEPYLNKWTFDSGKKFFQTCI